MSIQSQAMHQLLLQEYKTQQERLRQIKEKLDSQSEKLDRKIEKQLQRLKQISQVIIINAANRTKLYVESLEQDSSSSNVININILSSYLKQQKSHLSELISSQTTGALDKKPKSGKELLHNLSKRKKVQKYFQHLQCFQLEKQIEYLQKNILLEKVSKRKQIISYDNVESVTLKQEQQIKEKMKMLLDQLERVVGLSSQCGGNNDDRVDRKLFSLKQQAQRLKQIEELVDKQTKQIIEVKDFFNTQKPSEVIQLLQQKLYELKNNAQKDQPITKPQINYSLSKDQIEFLERFQCHPLENLKIYKKPFDQVNDLIISCKAKLKKVKL